MMRELTYYYIQPDVVLNFQYNALRPEHGSGRPRLYYLGRRKDEGLGVMMFRPVPGLFRRPST